VALLIFSHYMGSENPAGGHSARRGREEDSFNLMTRHKETASSKTMAGPPIPAHTGKQAGRFQSALETGKILRVERRLELSGHLQYDRTAEGKNAESFFSIL
jgi:hypothetical protein